MKILALEFSTDERGAAVAVGESGGEARVLGVAVQAEGRSTRAFGLIGQALAQAGLGREAIKCVAVGLGPGSYTGIRSAIAIAQGWQLARGVGLLGVSSAECLARQAAARGWSRFTVAIDAQQQEFYTARYERGPAGLCEVERLRLSPFKELAAWVAAGEVLVGPGLTRWFPEAHGVNPEASMVARLGAERAGGVRGEELEPIYLRPVSYVKAPPPRWGGPSAAA